MTCQTACSAFNQTSNKQNIQQSHERCGGGEGGGGHTLECHLGYEYLYIINYVQNETTNNNFRILFDKESSSEPLELLLLAKPVPFIRVIAGNSN